MGETYTATLITYSFGILFGFSVAYSILSARKGLKKFQQGVAKVDLAGSFLRGFHRGLEQFGLSSSLEADEYLRHRINGSQAEGVLDRYGIKPQDRPAASEGAGLAFAALVRSDGAIAATQVSREPIARILAGLCPGFFPIC